MITIIDRKGNEHPLAIRDLVMTKPGDHRQKWGRVTHAWRANGMDWCEARCEVSGWVHELAVSQCFLLSKEGAGASKEPALPVRYRRLRNNMLLASRNAEGADRALLFRLGDLFRGTFRSEYNWLWETVTESLDNPRQISYAPRPELMDNDARRIRTGIGKFVKKAVREWGADFTEAEADRLSELFGELMPSDYNYTFEVVSGQKVVDAYYDEENYCWGSCMSGKPYVWWYAENPRKVELLRINCGGRYAGRALLWNTDQGVKVLDRVYPSDNGPHTVAAHNLAVENGWDYKKKQCSADRYLLSGRTDYTVTMAPSTSGEYPYCDTFKYTSDDPEDSDQIVLNLEGGDFIFNDTVGDWEGGEARCHCENCGARVHEDDANLANGYYYCNECYADLFAWLNYRTPGGQYREGDYPRSECERCSYCHEVRLSRDFEEVRGEDVCVLCIEADCVACEKCEEYEWSDDVTEIQDIGWYCERCANTHCSTCDRCHEPTNRDDLASSPEEIEGEWCHNCRGVPSASFVAEPSPSQPELPITEPTIWRCTTSCCAHCSEAGPGIPLREVSSCTCNWCNQHRQNNAHWGTYAERLQAAERAASSVFPEMPLPDSVIAATDMPFAVLVP